MHFFVFLSVSHSLTRPQVHEFTSHTKWVLSCAFHYDDTHLATCGNDQMIFLWNLATQVWYGMVWYGIIFPMKSVQMKSFTMYWLHSYLIDAISEDHGCYVSGSCLHNSHSWLLTQAQEHSRKVWYTIMCELASIIIIVGLACLLLVKLCTNNLDMIYRCNTYTRAVRILLTLAFASGDVEGKILVWDGPTNKLVASVCIVSLHWILHRIAIHVLYHVLYGIVWFIALSGVNVVS